LEAAVQTTLRRLIAQSEVALSIQEGTRRYVIGPGSGAAKDAAHQQTSNDGLA
jgi:hypothetical protein